jgi:hypothetical protein
VILALGPTFLRDKGEYGRLIAGVYRTATYVAMPGEYLRPLGVNLSNPSDCVPADLDYHIQFYTQTPLTRLTKWIQEERELLSAICAGPCLDDMVRQVFQRVYCWTLRAISRRDVSTVVVWGQGNVMAQGALRAASEARVKVGYFEKGFFPQSYIISEDIPYFQEGSDLWRATKGFAEEAGGAGLKTLAEVGTRFIEEWRIRRQSKYPSLGRSRGIGAAVRGPVDLLVGQVHGDKQVASAEVSPEQAVVNAYVRQRAQEREAIFRLHPYTTYSQRRRIEDLLGQLSGVRIEARCPLFDHLDCALRVFTYNSTVGLEAAILEKDVYLCDEDAFYAPVLAMDSTQRAAYVGFLVTRMLMWSDRGVL